jgi:ferric-dicitrate binding protein FerR (iron transport regulator)
MILFYFLFISSLFAESLDQHNLGAITQLKGVATFFPFQGLRSVTPLSQKSVLREGGSYLSHEKSFFTVKLFDGTWLKVSPSSKFSLEINPELKEIQLNLYSGSVKVLFSGNVTQSKMKKFIITTGDGRFETSEAKFSVFRNILESTGYIYVEKGLVMVSRNQQGSNGNELVHAQEMTALKDRDSTIESPRKISENQMKFLNSSFYLGSTKSFE